MSTDEKYNGWTNYETWVVNLWMGNDEGSCSYWEEMAQEAYDRAEGDNTFTREEQATLDLSRLMQEEFEENCPEVTVMWADLLSSALSEVNWYEIAEGLMENVEKEAEDTDNVA
jgi:hypothetical protein